MDDDVGQQLRGNDRSTTTARERYFCVAIPFRSLWHVETRNLAYYSVEPSEAIFNLQLTGEVRGLPISASTSTTTTTTTMQVVRNVWK